mgnify:CR=1 FL=1
MGHYVERKEITTEVVFKLEQTKIERISDAVRHSLVGAMARNLIDIKPDNIPISLTQIIDEESK